MDREISVEVRVLSVGEDMAKRLKKEARIDCDRCRATDDPAETPQITSLDEARVKELLEVVQADPQTNVMQAPKLTVLNGQRGAFSHWITTGS